MRCNANDSEVLINVNLQCFNFYDKALVQILCLLLILTDEEGYSYVFKFVNLHVVLTNKM